MNSFLHLEDEICRVIGEVQQKHFYPTIRWERDEVLISDILLKASSRMPLDVLETRLHSELPQSYLGFLKFHQGFIHVLKGFPELECVVESVPLVESYKDVIALPHEHLSCAGFLRLASLAFLRSRFYSALSGKSSLCDLDGALKIDDTGDFLSKVLTHYQSKHYESVERLESAVIRNSIVYLSNQTLARRSFNSFYTDYVLEKNIRLKTMPKKWIEGVLPLDEKNLVSRFHVSKKQDFALLLMLASDVEASYLDFDAINFEERSQLLFFFDSVSKRRLQYEASTQDREDDFAKDILIRINFFNRVLSQGLSTGSVENILSYIDIVLFDIVCFFNKKSHRAEKSCSYNVLERIDWFFEQIEKCLLV